MEAAAEIRAEIAALPRRYTPEVRDVRRRWSQTLKPSSAEEVLGIALVLERASPQEGKWVAYELIRFHPGAFAALGEAAIADLTGRAQSWYAVDALGTILTGPLWAKGRLPDALIEAWSRSPDGWLRRSALVATVGAKADATRTLAICRRLAPDRDDMVEKAMSWALRTLSQRDRPAVEAFMAEMDRALPARVIREVRNKLRTGLKSGRR
jgi:3-methyladenine DNA glycosylase AlkD